MPQETELVTGHRAGRREWIGLAVIALACVLYVMDLTVLHLAVPALSRDLEPTSAQLLWIIDIYGFLVAGSLITMGTLGDRIGRRRLLMWGAGAFGVTSVLAALSTSAEMLIVTRGLMGLAGATVAPSTLSLIRSMFLDPQQRTVAIGVWVTSFSVGGAIGPVLGGLVLEFFWWGAVFLLAVPVMALLLFLGPRMLPEYRDPNPGRLDVLSAGWSLVAVLAVISGLKELAQDGIGWVALASVAGGGAAGAAFVRRQRRLTHPLIDLGLFRTRAFSAALATYGFGVFLVFGCFLFLPQYLQLVHGLSPLMAGVWTLPWALAFIVGSNVTPALARRFPPATVMATGLTLAAAGFVVLATLSPSSSRLILVAGSVAFSLGASPLFTLTVDLIIGSAPPEKAGAAAGLSETAAELGGALGIAIFGTIGLALYRSGLDSSVLARLPAESVVAVRDTLGGAIDVAARLPGSGSVGAALVDTAQEAFTLGLQVGAGLSALLALGLGGLVMARLRDIGTGVAPTSDPSGRPDLR